MKLEFLGGGKVGGTLGAGWASRGHEVMFGVRDPAAADMQAILRRSDGHARAAAVADAAVFADVIVNALPWDAAKPVLPSLNLKGKILLDVTNPFLPGLAGLEVGTTTSGAELAAKWAAGACVVKIFNTTGFG